MITFSCQFCHSPLTIDDQFAGQSAQCATCKAVVTVPTSRPIAVAHPPAPVPPAILRPPGRFREAVRRFGFNCPWCSSRLEATLTTAGQPGQCPTCANTIRIPILDRYGRLIDADSKQIIKPDPHPVHAYAAAGDRAPLIVRTATGGQNIQCPRCNAISLMTANSCSSCGIPFTLEGTLQGEKSASNGFATSSLILGVLGIPTCMIFLPSLLAIVFGIIALVQIRGISNKSVRATAIAGMACGAVGLLFNAWRLF